MPTVSQERVRSEATVGLLAGLFHRGTGESDEVERQPNRGYARRSKVPAQHRRQVPGRVEPSAAPPFLIDRAAGVSRKQAKLHPGHFFS